MNKPNETPLVLATYGQYKVIADSEGSALRLLRKAFRAYQVNFSENRGYGTKTFASLSKSDVTFTQMNHGEVSIPSQDRLEFK